MLKKSLSIAIVAASLLTLNGCGYNTLQSQDEAANAAWAEVTNQYQRRADLIPNLVATVKGYAQHEDKVLTEVTEARSKVGSIQMSAADAADPAKMQQYSAAQSELTGALSRLLVVSENYPQLKADQNFRDLQAQLEGTENRVALARNQYIQAVQTYNANLRQFPNNLTGKIFGMQPRPQFTADNEKAISTTPKVSF